MPADTCWPTFTLMLFIVPDTDGDTPTSPGLTTVPDADTVDETSPTETTVDVVVTAAALGCNAFQPQVATAATATTSTRFIARIRMRDLFM